MFLSALYNNGKWIILLVSAILLSGGLSCMEIEEKHPIRKEYVRLLLNDGHEIIVPRLVAEKSTMLATLLNNQMLLDDTDQQEIFETISFKNSSTNIVEQSLRLLFVNGTLLDGYKKWLSGRPLEEKIGIMKFLSMLEVGDRANDVAHAIADEVYTKRNPAGTLIKYELADEDREKIVRAYFFKTGTFLDGIKEVSFSCKELVARIPKKLATYINYRNESGDFSYLRINSLDGIAEIEGIQTLRVLKLTNNVISDFNSQFFTGFNRLLKLYLDDNPIGILSENAFDHLPSLTALYLERCKIRQIHKNAFRALKKLTLLFLCQNDLEAIDPEMLIPLTSLATLRLSQNKITDCNQAVCERLKKIPYVYLDHNPLGAEARERLAVISTISYR